MSPDEQGRAVQAPPQVAAVLEQADKSSPNGRAAPAPSPPKGSGVRRTLWVQLPDAEYTVETAYGDGVRYEEYAKQPMEGSLTSVAFLAWAALRRTRQLDMKFPEFRDRVLDIVDTTEEDDEAVPT